MLCTTREAWQRDDVFFFFLSLCCFFEGGGLLVFSVCRDAEATRTTMGRMADFGSQSPPPIVVPAKKKKKINGSVGPRRKKETN